MRSIPCVCVLAGSLAAGLLAASPALAVDPPAYTSTWGQPGSGNGQFSVPFGVAVDQSTGAVYVADYANNRVQKFDADGAYILTVGNGSGSGDGQFFSPWGVGVDAAGNVYVADRGNHRIQKFTSLGAFILKWGGPTAGSGNGQFNAPYRVAISGDNKVYVADGKNNRIQIFTDTGTFLSKWDTPGQFVEPCGIVVTASAVFVADLSNYVQKFDLSGSFITKWGGLGNGNGQFLLPSGLALGGDILYVADFDNHRVQGFDLNGTYLFKFGAGIPGSQPGQFDAPADVATGPSGAVYVADSNNDRIQKFVQSVVPVLPVSWGQLKTKYAPR